jgi:hypothetical protein
MQAVVNAAPTAGEGHRVAALVSALVSAGITGGYLANARLKQVHWQAQGRVVRELPAAAAGESVLFVDPAGACQIFCVSLGQSLSFCYITVGSFRRPGQTGTRSGNVTANAFMAAFQPRVPVPRCPLSRTSPSPSMWRPVTFLIPR